MERRDCRGRILQRGESQRSDGLYMFRYMNEEGERKVIYSWRLVMEDAVPEGKRSCEPLRELESQIRVRQNHFMLWDRNWLTLNCMFDEYMMDKRGLKERTRIEYQQTYDRYVRASLGNRKITEIRFSEIKRFYNHLIWEKGLSPASVKIVDSLLHPIFQMALRDEIIALNPTEGALRELRKNSPQKMQKRIALTRQEQEAFLQFVKETPTFQKWLNILVVMLGTGCRVGEITGLTWADCDFKKNVIHVRNNLQYYASEQDGRYTYHLTTVKSHAGNREIPMVYEVRKALLQEKRSRRTSEVVIDGRNDFVFVKKKGSLYNKADINHAIRNIINAHNQQEMKKARMEGREPFLIRHISCHNLRHTFATRFCENESNMKAIQEIMGHTDIKTTMNIYAEATLEIKENAMKNMENIIKLS